MRLCKIILIVSMLSVLNIFAADTITYDGDVKLFYMTSDISKNGEETKSIFNKEVSAFDAALRLSISAEPIEGLSVRATGYGVSTLGLDNKLAVDVWSGAHGAKQKADGDLDTDDALWLGEAWLANTMHKTTLKLGRMPLDTPLIFTETWDIAPNTFEAAVLKNESLPNTVLVGAWVPRSNGIADDSSAVNLGSTVSKSGDFHTFGEDGAWSVGIVNSTLSWLTLQGWYYDFIDMQTAYWLQADLNLDGVLVGFQYASVNPDGSGMKKSDGYAIMLGYAMADSITVKLAFSATTDDGDATLNNAATGVESKLYTELWWANMAGNVAMDTVALTLDTTFWDDVAMFTGFYYADHHPKEGKQYSDLSNMTEIVLSMSKSFGPLETSVALIYDDPDYFHNQPGDIKDETMLQLYLTYTF